MGDNNISEKLKALATGSNRSATARLREIFDEIEAALQSGVRRKDVHQTLTENGFSISFASFELAIYRIRKAREVGKNKTSKPEEPVSEKRRPGKAEEKPVEAVKSEVEVKGKEVAAKGANPFSHLTGNRKEGEHSAIPTAKFELDDKS